MAFLDLMAYTRGQQEAQNDNWRDVFNDARASQMQQALNQNQLNFDLEFPLRQLAAENALNADQGKRALSALFTQYDTRAPDIPADMRPDYTVDWLKQVRSSIDPNAPGASTTLAGLNDRARAWMAEFARAGNTDAARRIAETMSGPGADVGNQIQAITAWNNPTGDMIRAAGGTVDDANPGYITTREGIRMPAWQFYALQQQQAANPMSGVFANGMARQQGVFDAQQRQQDLTNQQRSAALATQQQLKAAGYDSVVGANGQVIPLGRTAVSTTATPVPGAVMNPQTPGFQVDPSYGASNWQQSLGLPVVDTNPATMFGPPNLPAAMPMTPALPVVPQVPRDMSNVPAVGTTTPAERLAALRQSNVQQEQAQQAANAQAAAQYAETVLASRDQRGAFQLQSNWALFNALPQQTRFQIYMLVNGMQPANTGGATGGF